MANKKKLLTRANRVIVGPSGDPEEVVLRIDDYEKLMAMVEDIADTGWMESMHSEEKHAVTWEDVKRRLKEDGLL